MHILQPKITKLKPNEVESILKRFNASLSQIPKIKSTDPGLGIEAFSVGEVIKVERKEREGTKTNVYYRVVA